MEPLLPPPPKYEKGQHPDDLLSEGSALEKRAVAAAARHFFGGDRVQLFGPALVFAVRTPCGYLSATRDGRVMCDASDPASPNCAFRFQKGGVAAHFRLTIRSELTGRRLRLENGTTISATGGQGDGEAPDEEKFMYFNHEFDPPEAFPGDSMTFCASRNKDLMLFARRPGLQLGPAGTPFYLVNPISEQGKVNALLTKRVAKEKQVADAAALRDLAAKQEYADKMAAVRIAEHAEAAAAAKAAARQAAANEEKLLAELELARKQAETAKAEAEAAKQAAADSIAAAKIAEKAALERAAAQMAAAAFAREASPPVGTTTRRTIPNALYIPNIPDGVTAETLKARFITYGRVTSCVVIPHKDPGKTGHYAFVDFQSIDAAQKAMAAKVVMNKVELQLRIKTTTAVDEPKNSLMNAQCNAPGAPTAGQSLIVTCRDDVNDHTRTARTVRMHHEHSDELTITLTSAQCNAPGAPAAGQSLIVTCRDDVNDHTRTARTVRMHHERASSDIDGFEPRPFPPLDAPRNQIAEHAETLAAQYMQWLGFSDAARCGHINQPDGGIDISSTHAVAQVKAQWSSKIPRPLLQAFTGACIVKEHMLKGHRLFFAPSYSPDAIAYADELNMRLFTFDAGGQVSPENMAAKSLLASMGKPVHSAAIQKM